MSSVSEDGVSGNEDSENEQLSVLKRKCREIPTRNIKKPCYAESDDEEEVIIPQVLVKVEVEEVDEKNPFYSGAGPSKPKRKKPWKTAEYKRRTAFPCSECDSVFAKGSELKAHSVVHQEQTRHKCDHCGRCFHKAFSLRLHRRAHLEKLKCPLCDQQYSLKVHLGRHLRTHEKNEQCTQCGEKFHTPDQLEEHMGTHNSDRQPNPVPGEVSAPHGTQIKIELEVESDCDRNSSYEEPNCDRNSSYEEPPDPYQNGTDEPCLKREDLSHATQCAIVNKLHKGRPIPDVCRLYNLTPEVVNSIWEDREKYIIPKHARKRTMKYMNSVVDKQIIDWFNAQRANEVQVSGKMLQDTAETIAKECGFVFFNGTKKWLDRFKQRYKICLRGVPSTRDYHNLSAESKWKQMFFKEQWCDFRFGVDDCNIYTADEVGLFYNHSNGRIKKFGGRKFIQGHVKDRLSIFMCANATGTDKRKLLVCGTEDPLIRSYRNPDTLPVNYIRQNQAHFTTQIFEQYVKYWNAELQVQSRKALLVIDRANIHTKLQMSNLKLVFVPWKASSGLMPIKSGIFTRFRQDFRKLYLEEKTMNAIRGIDRNMTCLEALNMLEKAWERMPADVIYKGFESTGYDIKPIQVPETPASNDEEILCNMLKDYDAESYLTDLTMLDMYLTVDDEYLTGQGTNGSVFGGNHKTSKAADAEKCDDILPLATEKPLNLEIEAYVRRTRALEDLEIVRRYLHTSDTSYDTYCSYMDVEKFLLQNVSYCDPSVF